MARIRTIKPEFFTSEDIVQLTPLARLLYIASWCEADKEGRLLWRPKTMKLRYFPADSFDIEAVAQELVDARLIVPYAGQYALIPGFKTHQHLNPRESDSKLPDPNTGEIKIVTNADASRRVGTRRHASNLELTDREEGKGREVDSRQDRESQRNLNS